MNRIYSIEEQTLTGMADAVRRKTGIQDRMTPAEMTAAVLGIHDVALPDVSAEKDGMVLGVSGGAWTVIPGGPAGPVGKSAYDVYRAHGGTLTEEQWLVSLCQGAPLYAASAGQRTDTDRIYVMPDGHLWAYGATESGLTTTTGWYDTGLTYVPIDCEDRLVALETAHTGTQERLDALEAGSSPALPSGWQRAIRLLEEQMVLRQKNGADVCQFLWCSDLHGVQEGVTARIGKVARALCDKFALPLVAVTGGVLAPVSETNDAAVRYACSLVRDLLSPIASERLLLGVGEYDGLWGDPAKEEGFRRDIGPRDLYSQLCRPQAADWTRRYGPDGLCCYVDLRPANIRVIMLNTHTGGDGRTTEDGLAVFDRRENAVLGTDQLAWLQQEALAAPEGWGLVLLSHMPIQDVKDGALLAGIIAAHKHRTAYAGGSVELQCASWGDQLENCACNTSTAAAADYRLARSEIIACFHGHDHQDSIDVTSLAVPSIGITAAGSDVRDLDAPERVPGSATETALDLVTIDRRERIIYLNRVGAGHDRSVSFDSEVTPVYSVAYALTDAVASAQATHIVRGETFGEMILPVTEDGSWHIPAITVTMGGEDVTDRCTHTLGDGWAILLKDVQGDIVVTAAAQPVLRTCTVSSTLAACSLSSTAATVDKNTPYTATLTPAYGYGLTSVTVTMGGEDVTSAVYAGGVITIGEVTGDIVITAEAEPVDLLHQYGIKLNRYVFDAGTRTQNGYFTTGELPVDLTKGHMLHVRGLPKACRKFGQYTNLVFLDEGAIVEVDGFVMTNLANASHTGSNSASADWCIDLSSIAPANLTEVSHIQLSLMGNSSGSTLYDDDLAGVTMWVE